MNTGQIAIPKRLAYASIAVLGILIAVFLFAGNFSAFDFGCSQNGAASGTGVDSTQLAAGSREKFDFLSGRGEQRSVGST